MGSVDLVEVKVESSSLINDQYDWLCESRMGGGALNLLGTQLIDVCQFVLNRKAQRVSATLRNSHKPSINGIYTVDADDFCVLTIWLDNGCLVTITINCNFPMIKYSHEISLFGEKGWIRVKVCLIITMETYRSDYEFYRITKLSFINMGIQE